MPKNAQGLSRSKEFMKAHEEQAPKLHHVRVHPMNEDGVVKVTHHAGPTTAPHETHAFAEHEGEQMVNHLMEHSGMEYDSEGGGDHYADESKARTA